MSKQKRNLKPRCKLWLSTGKTEGVFGDGKWRILEAVDSEGSLSAAAKSLGISYRKAWGDIKKAEEYLGVALIEKHHGGKAGGSASLTSMGRKWMKAYGKFRSKVEKEIAKAHREDIASL